jgi:hypothetical protein
MWHLPCALERTPDAVEMVLSPVTRILEVRAWNRLSHSVCRKKQAVQEFFDKDSTHAILMLAKQIPIPDQKQRKCGIELDLSHVGRSLNQTRNQEIKKAWPEIFPVLLFEYV